MFHQACMKGQRPPLETTCYSEISTATIRNTEVKEAQGVGGKTSPSMSIPRIFVNKLE